MEYGYYLFDNRYIVNMEVIEKDTFTTVIHELTHMSITQQSKYGLFIQLLNKANEIDSTYNSLNSYFINHMKKMQEGCCTFAEMLLIISANGYSEFKKRVNSLKDTNKEYHKYLKPFLRLMDYCKDNEERSCSLSLSSDYIYNIVLNLAICSCDVDATEIGVEFFTKNCKNKSDKGIRIDGDKAVIYLPDSRFKKLLDALKNELDTHKDEECSENLIESIIENVYKSIKYIKLSDEEKDNAFSQALTKCKDFIEDLFADSSDLELIRNLIGNFDVKSVNLERLLGFSIPESQNRMYEFNEIVRDISDFINKNNDVYFILGDKKVIQNDFPKIIPSSFIKEKFPINSKTSNISKNILSIAKSISFKGIIIYGFEFPNKRINPFFLKKTKRDVIIFLEKVGTPLVINYKFYSTYDYLSSNCSNEVFVYCDRAYENTIELINKLANARGPLLYNVIDFTNNQKDASFSVFIVKIKENHYFLLPIVKSSIILISSDILNCKLNVIPGLEVDDSLINKINLIINCIYYY